jgi:uncharacterized delta-60 repeat protein
MTTCICLSYSGPTPLGPTIQLTCNPSGTIINESTVNLTVNCPYCITVPSGTTTITAFDPITNCTEVIPVEPVTDTPCSSGMDVVFCIDYTGSMGVVIDEIKSNVGILANTIELLSQNNYRLGLVIFDEFNVPIPVTYNNSTTYINLPPSQKYVNSNVTASIYQFITAMEVMSPNNQVSFSENLEKLALSPSFYLHKLNPDGQQATTINGNPTNASVFAVKTQSFDGKIVYGGSFTFVQNSPYENAAFINYFTRMTTDGKIDTSFITGNGFDNFVETIDINSIGQIIVGGLFSSYQGIPRNGIALVNTNGGINLGFNPGIGFNASPNTVKFDQNGKIVVVGQFTSYNLNTCNRIIRLNIDGTPDIPFLTNIGSGFNGVVTSVDFQSVGLNNGKIIVTGTFTSFNGTPCNRIVRLNSDGTIDPTFVTNIGTGFGTTTNSVKVQTDDKIIVGGNFSSFNGTPCNYITRLNSDGTIDNPFVTNIGSGFNGAVTSIELQSIGSNNGKIIVGGNFNSFNSNTRRKIVRLNTNGTIDSSFGLCGSSPGFNTSNSLESISIDNQDNIFAAIIGQYNIDCYVGMGLGGGNNSPEPSDMAIDRIVNYNFAGTFNPSNAKYIVLITDASPSGNDDAYTPSIDQVFIQNTLIPSCQANNVKVILVRPPYNYTIFALEQFALATGGAVVVTPFNQNFNVNQVATALSTLC